MKHPTRRDEFSERTILPSQHCNVRQPSFARLPLHTANIVATFLDTNLRFALLRRSCGYEGCHRIPSTLEWLDTMSLLNLANTQAVHDQ